MSPSSAGLRHHSDGAQRTKVTPGAGMSQTTQTTRQRRAQTLPWQRAVNRLIRGLLRTPLVCQLVGRRLITVYVVGRATGRRFAVPIAYTRHDDALLVGTPFRWGRNLRTGEPVEIRLRGKR